jgi:hypothetical protein
MHPQPTDRNSFDDKNLNRRKPVSTAHDLPEPLLDSDEAASIMKIHPKHCRNWHAKELCAEST